MFVGKLGYPAGGWMDSLEEIVKRKSVLNQNDDLAIQNELPGLHVEESFYQLRKVSRQGLTRFGL